MQIQSRQTKYICPTENQEQRQLIRLWEDYCLRTHYYDPDVLLHIPNEGKRTAVFGHNLKFLGMRKGTPDLFLAIPTEKYHGLWIEMKRQKGGRVSPEQEEMMKKLSFFLYKTVVARGASEAFDAILSYLKEN